MVGRFLFGMLAGPSLVAGLGAWLTLGFAAAEPIAIEATPIPLSAEEHDRDTVGQLRYRGGLHLSTDNSRFGGLSALGISATSFTWTLML